MGDVSTDVMPRWRVSHREEEEEDHNRGGGGGGGVVEKYIHNVTHANGLPLSYVTHVSSFLSEW